MQGLQPWWMELPVLIEIKAVTANAQKQNVFTVKVNLKTPAAETEGAESKDKPTGGNKS